MFCYRERSFSFALLFCSHFPEKKKKKGKKKKKKNEEEYFSSIFKNTFKLTNVGEKFEAYLVSKF